MQVEFDRDELVAAILGVSHDAGEVVNANLYRFTPSQEFGEALEEAVKVMEQADGEWVQRYPEGRERHARMMALNTSVIRKLVKAFQES